MIPHAIHVLPPAVAERIAAGEVIERPSSVVKELVENSIDAGATEIAVFLEDGGKGLIEVLDNGHGMSPRDLELCLERHATSKLGTLEDLEKIETLGFRGEALPSIAAVTELSLVSRKSGEDTAYEVRVTAFGQRPRPETATFGHFLGSPQGTRVQARGLFSQVPARLKFLKSQGAEVAQTREWIERLALAHPNVGFRLSSDGRNILALRPQTEIERVRAILSDGEDYPAITQSNDPRHGGPRIHVHWLQGMSSPQSRRVLQMVNGRALKDRLLQQALLSPFRQALLPGQFPSIALYIDIEPSEIDVNVHPTKTEVRFLDSRRIFREVQSLVESMIARNGAPAYASAPSFAAAPDFAKELAGDSSWSAAQPFSLSSSATAPDMPVAWNGAPSYQLPLTTSESAIEPGTPAASSHAALSYVEPSQFVGAIFNTYLLYDQGEELVLIDQHAAHERIRYERLRDSVFGAKTPSSQALLIPEAVRFDPESRTTLEARLGWLIGLGFEAEVFGADTLLFRAVPAAWGTEELRVRLKNLMERLLSLEADATRILLDETLFEKLASEACHSSVRAGDRLGRDEASSIVEQLFRTAHPWNCPHGRPTATRIPRARFEEWFRRRV